VLIVRGIVVPKHCRWAPLLFDAFIWLPQRHALINLDTWAITLGSDNAQNGLGRPECFAYPGPSTSSAGMGALES
jgi:hypothetical protein